MATYTYVNGPCDGRKLTTRQPLADGAVLNCGGAGYQFNRDVPGALQWLDVGASFTPAGPLAPKAHTAWHDLQQAVNRSLPTALRRSKTIRLAAARKLARGRR